jgi:hypothetical protein
LIGVVPNCDPYLEIWPPAFRTYNVMVPNFLNLPFLVWGFGARRATIGLAMYVASRTAACAYCSAHTCSFALRRGATVDQVATALEADANLAAPERAAIRVARSIARVPADLREEERAALRQHFSDGDVEWIVLSIAMMGWLNKMMDALGVPLELSTVEEVNGVIERTGWTPGKHMKEAPRSGAAPRADSLMTMLSIIRHAPAALSLDKEWTAGVPGRWPAVGDFLRQATGHDFPVLSRIKHERAIRAIATMIRDNFAEGVIERDEKLATGLVYAEIVGDAALAEELRKLGAKALGNSPVQILARAISPSPAAVDESVMESIREIQPAGIIEVLSFVSVMQMLHRREVFYG